VQAYLRRAARRPRSAIAAVRGHRSTRAAVDRGKSAFERAALARGAQRDRRTRGDEWARLLQQLAALPAPAVRDRAITTVVIGRGETAAAAAARVTAPDADVLCFQLASTAALEPHWQARLAAAIDGATIVAAAPTAVHPLRTGGRSTPHDGRVRARGVSLAVAEGAPWLRADDAGAIPAPDAVTSRPVDGATAACLLVDRRSFEAAGGMPESAEPDIAIFELCRRLRARGGTVVALADAVVVDARPVRARRALVEAVATDTEAWRTYVEAHGAELLRAESPRPAGLLRISFTVAAPSAKVAPRWGDWHLAQAFARSLRKLGHVVEVHTLDHADDLAVRSCDVHVVVRGLRPVRRTPGQAHVLWVISHPESITAQECDDADLVLVASSRFADELRARTRTPVEVMLQATDTDRFRPVVADPEHAHDVAVVAKSRDVFRPAVAAAVAEGLRPAIYGTGWEPFVDRELLVHDYVANDELPVVYSSVGVLLTDHWETMRKWGFVSNRVFDALACETPVISEDLPEIAELFDGAVLTFHDPPELRALTDAVLTDRGAARARAARGRALIEARHTFDHRAAQLIDALDRHQLVPRPGDAGS
jgi:glycosyltransferase involved in cell wall biosynthesis